MREIECKFWLGHIGKMTYSHTIKEMFQLDWDITDDIIPLQFIGLLDKHGIKIFEGDIVKDRSGRIMEAGWWNYRLCWIAITETNFHHADFYDWIKSEDRNDDDKFLPVKTMTEIIGNRYENPELLTPTQS